MKIFLNLLGSIINANDANMYLHEATVAEKQPLAVATVTTNGFHHRQNRHSRHSLTYPHHMQPGDEVNKQITLHYQIVAQDGINAKGGRSPNFL